MYNISIDRYHISARHLCLLFVEFFVIFDKLTKGDTFVKLLQNSNLVAIIRRGTERVKDTIEKEIDKILLEIEAVEKDILNDESRTVP